MNRPAFLRALLAPLLALFAPRRSESREPPAQPVAPITESTGRDLVRVLSQMPSGLPEPTIQIMGASIDPSVTYRHVLPMRWRVLNDTYIDVMTETLNT